MNRVKNIYDETKKNATSHSSKIGNAESFKYRIIDLL